LNSFTWTTVILFLVFTAYMMLAALVVKKAVKRQSRLTRAVHVVLLVTSFFLVCTQFPLTEFLGLRVVPDSNPWGFFGVAVCSLGLTFCFWARRTLGGNWSGTVTLKKGHELIQRGPYRLVRHPMYTGILLALLGAAVTVGQAGNFLGVALLAAAFRWKTNLEESYMTRHFGRRYSDYSKKVKRLIPYLY
jgi:protein-S-isoprenylcysteine O-methyltransferase Ste14